MIACCTQIHAGSSATSAVNSCSLTSGFSASLIACCQRMSDTRCPPPRPPSCPPPGLWVLASGLWCASGAPVRQLHVGFALGGPSVCRSGALALARLASCRALCAHAVCGRSITCWTHVSLSASLLACCSQIHACCRTHVSLSASMIACCQRMSDTRFTFCILDCQLS